MDEQVLWTIHFIVAGSLFVLSITSIAFEVGRGKLSACNAWPCLCIVGVPSLLWSALLGIALAISPFVGLFFFFRWLGQRSTLADLPPLNSGPGRIVEDK